MNLKSELKEQQERRKHNLLTQILLESSKKVSVFVYLFFVFNWCCHSAFGQNQSQVDFFNRTYFQIFNLEFERARSAIDSLDPNNPERLYFEHLMEAIPVFIWENEEDYDLFKDHTDDRVSILRSIKIDSPEKGYVLAEIRLHESILDIKFGKELFSAINFNKAHRNVERNIREFPDYKIQYKTSGLIDVVTGSVPDNYNWLVNLFGFSKDVDEGLKKISISSEFSNVIEQEASILNAATQIFLLGGELNSDILNEEGSESPYLFKYIASFLYNKDGEGSKSLKLVQELVNDVNTFKLEELPHTYYLQGINLLQKGDYVESIQSLQKFRTGFTGFNLLKDAEYKLALAYQITNKPDSSEFHLKNVLELGNTFTESDKYAERTAEEGKLPMPVINQLRLSTDGGYFSFAEQIIAENDSKISKDNDDFLEWEYRKARLYHRSNRPDKSIPFYEEVISNSSESDNLYFPPNSCLQLGYIYLSKKDYDQADKYFRKVLEYNKYPYESSIKNKAKSGLDQINSN